jgi:hypothetical protein
MKTASFFVAALTSAALAKPHQRRSPSLPKREVVYVDETVETVTVTVCALGNAILPELECEQGINNGTLRWADEGEKKVTVNLVRTYL